MDLQVYYGKMKAELAAMADEFPVVVSHDTQDGGKAGRFTEVTKRIAARMIIEGLARLATGEETSIFRAAKAEAREAAQRAITTAQFGLAALAAEELSRLQQKLGGPVAEAHIEAKTEAAPAQQPAAEAKE